MSSTFPTSTTAHFLQHFLGNFHPRKLLAGIPFPQTVHLASPPQPASGTNPDPLEPDAGNRSFDVDVTMVIVVLLCAVFCSLGLNTIIRCSFRCSSSILQVNSSSAARRVRKGIKQEVLKSFRTFKYSPENKFSGLDTDCVICLSEFVIGDYLRILPKCNHGFHVKCIDKWLSSHSSCPMCRHCLIETCKNVAANSSQATSSIPEPPVPIQEIVIRIAPLDREGTVNGREAI